MNISQNTILEEYSKIFVRLNITFALGLNVEKAEVMQPYRVICDKESHYGLLVNNSNETSINKYWKEFTDLSKTTNIHFDKYFKNFMIIIDNPDNEFEKPRNYKVSLEEKSESESESGLGLVEVEDDSETKEYEYAIDFQKESFKQMTLFYVDKQLTEAQLLDENDNKKSLILLNNQDNKSRYQIEFNFTRPIQFLLPIIKDNKVVAFIIKYSDKTDQVKRKFKELESDIIIPNIHEKVLESIRSISLRIDMTYFLKSKINNFIANNLLYFIRIL